MKTRPVGAELFYADGWTDGQTDTTKVTVTLHNFAKGTNRKHLLRLCKKHCISPNIICFKVVTKQPGAILTTKHNYVNVPTICTFYIFIYSTIFMSTLHVSDDRDVHHQELIVVYCITQLCTIV